ncbi:alpha/beta fold hydrolase [Rhodalgimonas zhirmunskyi]|uniref:Alpha/beta hydrolase n=1 Tax=Rhodalgimonas zhirmunskyi TaxID=2964767 RepID=A0AAJ1X5M6_9RHOB|nr:alpha/beta hydrolase [Rhodoalgimonas zhirmunskyi]MDQ2092542.1 alpha/beta hydrolase [Rhodoalgimonas zhirmunskyi]
MIPGFSDHLWEGGETPIAYSRGGDGPPLLLLHGFPQCRAMWAEIAPVLAQSFTVIAADLRGYGGSGKPAKMEDYSFRAMARDQAGLMTGLGFDRFHLVGHDRGARTAHRLALDFGFRLASLTLMDIVPTHLLLDELSKDVAHAYYHWFFLSQPAPFPERLIKSDPDYFFESCLLGWGAAQREDFAKAQLAAYRAAWRDADVIRGMCNDYRAAIAVDFALDAEDLERRVPCPTLVLYGADGVMAQAYNVGETWADRCMQVTAKGIPGGHFFPDTAPQETATALMEFLSGSSCP